MEPKFKEREMQTIYIKKLTCSAAISISNNLMYEVALGLIKEPLKQLIALLDEQDKKNLSEMRKQFVMELIEYAKIYIPKKMNHIQKPEKGKLCLHSKFLENGNINALICDDCGFSVWRLADYGINLFVA